MDAPTSVDDTDIFKADRVPWLGLTVTIVKAGPLKGYQAVIKDVIRGQATSSQLRLDVQLLHLNPSAPFQRIVLDYDDVLESK